MWRLNQPASDLIQAEDRHKSYLLARVLFLAIPIMFIILVMVLAFEPYQRDHNTLEEWLTLGMWGVLVIAFVMNRRGHYQQATMLIACAASVTLLIISMLDTTSLNSDVLLYLNLIVLFASIFLSLTAMIALIVLDGIGIALVLIVTGSPVSRFLEHPVNFVVLSTLLLLIILLNRSQLESNLRHSEASFRMLMEHQPETILILSLPKFRIYATNRSMFLGYPLSQLLSGDFIDLHVRKAEHVKVHTYWERVRTGQLPAEMECHVQTSAGDWEVISHHAHVIDYHDNGAPSKVMITLKIMTQQWAIENQLKQRANIFESAFDAIVIMDGDFLIRGWNTAAETVYGWQADEVIGKTMQDVLRPQYTSLNRADLLQYLLLRNRWHGEITHRHRSGMNLRIESSMSVVRSPKGKPETIVAINRDVTQQREMEDRELKLAVERERMMMLERFMRDVAHDFRTPLTSIITSTYLLKRIQDEQKRQAHILAIEKQSKRLEELLFDLFNLERLDRGETGDYVFGKVRINELLQEIVDASISLLSAKEHDLNTTFEGVPAIMADPNRLARAFTNLLVNAINYTPPKGVINLRTYVQQDRVYIEFQDNGIGITSEDQKRIFDRFYRSDQARSVETGGTGLGLSITQKIIQAHGGEIEVESTPGKGSLFRVYLPLSLSQILVEEKDV
ncbi:MAG: PAS domain-containing sensor histidine kinase [Anaerolineae bacterium]|nr:PAS domain-containing sensor histidine kinase [Anaerolineae bacterium]